MELIDPTSHMARRIMLLPEKVTSVWFDFFQNRYVMHETIISTKLVRNPNDVWQIRVFRQHYLSFINKRVPIKFCIIK